MTQKVFKYPLQPVERQAVMLHVGSKPLHIARQDDSWFLWALVDPTAKAAQVEVLCLGTGSLAPEDIDRFDYLTTMESPPFMWHFFIKRLLYAS